MNEIMIDCNLKKEGYDYIEKKLDEADREAAASDIRYTEDEVFAAANEDNALLKEVIEVSDYY